MMLRFLLFPISWWLFIFLIQLPAILLGWILVPIAAACKAYEPYQGFDGAGMPRVQYRFTWKFMILFQNPEDGIADSTYFKSKTMFMQIIRWSCIRNPANGLRTIPYLSCAVNPGRIKFYGSIISSDFFIHESESRRAWFDKQVKLYEEKRPMWWMCWQGPYSCFVVKFNLFKKLHRFWIGYKLYPTSIYGATNFQKHGVGFALQFKKVK